MAAAVDAIDRSAEAQHIAAHTIAGISARDRLSASMRPLDVATRARMKATAPAAIAKATARLLSEAPSIAVS